MHYSITIIIEKRSHPLIFDVCGKLPKMYKNSLHFFPGRGGRGPALSLGLDTDLLWLVGQWQMQHNQRLEKCLCPGACPLCPVGKPGPASWRGRSYLERHVVFKSLYYGVFCYVAKSNCYRVSNKKNVVATAHYPISYLSNKRWVKSSLVFGKFSMSSPQSPLFGKTSFWGSFFFR